MKFLNNHITLGKDPCRRYYIPSHHNALPVNSSSTAGAAYYFIDYNSSQGSTNKTKTTLEYFKQLKTELIAQVLKELRGRAKDWGNSEISKSRMPVLSLGWWGKGRKCGAKPKARVTQRKLNHSKEQEPCRWCSWRHRRQRNTLFFLFFLPFTPIGRTWLEASNQTSWKTEASGVNPSELGEDWYKQWVPRLHLEARFYGKDLSLSNESQRVKTPQYRKYPEAAVGFVHLKSTPQRNWGKMPALDLYFSFPSLFLHFPPPTFPFSSSPQTGLKGEVSNRIAF